MTVRLLTAWFNASRTSVEMRSSAERSPAGKLTRNARGSLIRQRTNESINRFFFSEVCTRSATRCVDGQDAVVLILDVLQQRKLEIQARLGDHAHDLPQLKHDRKIALVEQ